MRYLPIVYPSKVHKFFFVLNEIYNCICIFSEDSVVYKELTMTELETYEYYSKLFVSHIDRINTYKMDKIAGVSHFHFSLIFSFFLNFCFTGARIASDFPVNEKTERA